MSVSLINKIFTPEELAVERQWLDIRDMLFGENGVKANVEQALTLVSKFNHPDAVYLSSIFTTPVSTSQMATTILLVQPKEDIQAMCFTAGFSRLLDYRSLKRAAKLGSAYAQAKMAIAHDYEEKRFLLRSGERQTARA